MLCMFEAMCGARGYGIFWLLRKVTNIENELSYLCWGRTTLNRSKDPRGPGVSSVLCKGWGSKKVPVSKRGRFKKNNNNGSLFEVKGYQKEF